ncbi:MAG: cell division protein FtsA [Ponticaulis sp.]|nr:cell division protein FtsA [Ponticaulis sp.]|tara:strand:- start:14923 stop:16230 length:1308 start_codon:yes stop_codon:yes gene_type:complete
MSGLEERLLASSHPRLAKTGQLVAALDLGATGISCLITRVTDPSAGGFELLGYGQQSSRGLKGGVVIDMDGLERSIRLAVEDAERMAGQQVSSVRMAVSGPTMKSFAARAEIEMGGREIGQRDVVRILEKALEAGEDDKRQILHAVPFSYSVDGSDGVRDPRGMFADKLGAHVNLISLPKPVMKNLLLCVSRAHLKIDSVSAGGFMGAEAVFADDERENGGICIDMGGGATGISVYIGGTLAWFETLAVGGSHVTSDIAQGIGTTLPAAERIKTLHGTVTPLETGKSDMVETPKIGDDGRLQSARMSKAELSQYIIPRVEETFELVSRSLSKSGLGGKLPRRAVLTGGASELPGVRELASRVLAMPVRLGRPIAANQLGDECAKPTFSTAAGLLTFDHARGGDPKAARKMVRPAAERDAEQGMIGRAFDWLKENF